VLVLLGGCTADSHTKKWAQTTLKGKPPVEMVRGFLEVGFVENRGMVFGFLNNSHAGAVKRGLLVLRIVLLFAVSIYILIRRNRSILFLLPFLLICAGAWGNVFDNVAYGYVIDFIHIHAGTLVDWPFFFNLADAYLCFGMAILVLKSVPQMKKNQNILGQPGSRQV
jgi:signal peptidase II